MEQKSRLDICPECKKFGTITSCEACGKRICISCLRGVRDKITNKIVELRCSKCAELIDPKKFTFCK